jgi:hypothetical protein
MRSIRKKVRVSKEESVYLYNIFEAQKGILAYSTLPHEVGSLYRELELQIPPDFVEEVDELLEALRKELGDSLWLDS